MLRLARFLALLLVVSAGVAVAASAADLSDLRDKAGLSALREPTKLIDFELENLAGKKVKLSSFIGKVVVLNFWATWCPPCRAEIPSLQALYDKLGKLGFEIVAVDLQEDKAKVSAFAKTNKMTFPILLDLKGEVGSTYGASAIPTSYVIDRRGYAIAGIQGSMEWNTEAAEQYMRALLAEKP
jgi:thiol-disulfide isomerase/thioredoxin